MPFDYATSPYPIPDRIPPAHRHTRERLAAPGQWWTGTERVGIAAAVRAAEDCNLCRSRKDALSIAAVEGEHDSDGSLPAPPSRPFTTSSPIPPASIAPGSTACSKPASRTPPTSNSSA